MSIIYIMIPLALLLVGLAAWALIWACKRTAAVLLPPWHWKKSLNL